MSSVTPITGAVALAMVLTALPGPLNAQVTTGQDSAAAPWGVPRNRNPGAAPNVAAALQSDTSFVRQAISGNALEVELGRVADSRADADSVEDFAERMVAEHGAMLRQWTTLARNNRMTVSTQLTSAERQAVDRLEALSGNAFDRSYMTNMIQLHERQLADFERAATSAQSPDVRRLAAAGVTSIRSHLALARQVGRGVGVGPGAVVATTPASDTASASGSVAADARHIREAVAGNGLEVRLAQVAQSRADHDDVEDFAERMARDHATMGRQWEALARVNGVTMGIDLGATKDRTVDRLEALSGNAFDRAYMTEMIRHHEQDLAALERAATSARSSEVRRLASISAKSVREHLALAREVGRDVGVTSVATADPRRADRDRDERDREDRGELRGEDRAFVMNVMADHLMHVRLAERARREARDGETRRFAERMEQDFTRWQKRWSDLAQRYDLTPPKGLGRLHGQKVERLERASRQNVDRTYASIVAEHLESVVPYFRKEGQAVRTAAVRRLVDEELPVIREHLERARRLQGQPSVRAERNERE